MKVKAKIVAYSYRIKESTASRYGGSYGSYAGPSYGGYAGPASFNVDSYRRARTYSELSWQDVKDSYHLRDFDPSFNEDLRDNAYYQKVAESFYGNSESPCVLKVRFELERGERRTVDVTADFMGATHHYVAPDEFEVKELIEPLIGKKLEAEILGKATVEWSLAYGFGNRFRSAR